MPKTRELIRRRARSSREYGSTDDSTAIPTPLRRTSPVHCGTELSPNGATATEATTMAMARPSSCEKAAPVRLERMTYAAQQAPARAASPSPIRSSCAKGTVSASEMRTTPAPAATTARKSTARRESTTVRTKGPTNSMVTATPMGRRPRDA
jgi:hypothetical protein